MYWVDYFGIRRARNILEPGTMYMERSYASHPWVIRIYKIGKAEPETQAHALMVRMGVDAANSGSTYTGRLLQLRKKQGWRTFHSFRCVKCGRPHAVIWTKHLSFAWQLYGSQAKPVCHSCLCQRRTLEDYRT